MNTPVANDAILKETSPWLVFQLFKNKNWQSNAVRLALQFAPKCVLPSCLGLISIAVWLTAIFLLMPNFQQINDMTEAFKTVALVMSSLLLSAITYMWSLALWLARLTAVARAVIALPEEEWIQPIASEKLLEQTKEAILQVKHRKGFLARYYLLISLYMLAPVVCMTICSAAVIGPKVIIMPGLVLPQWFEISAMIGFIASGVFLFIFSMISLVVSGACKPMLQKSVYKTIGLSVTCFLPCLALSLVVLTAVTLITEPLAPLALTQPAIVNAQTVTTVVLGFVWQSVVSVFVVPLSIIPFGELLRGRFE